MKVALYVWLTVRCSFYFIDRPTYIVLLANEPFSLAWSFAELFEPPVFNSIQTINLNTTRCIFVQIPQNILILYLMRVAEKKWLTLQLLSLE